MSTVASESRDLGPSTAPADPEIDGLIEESRARKAGRLGRRAALASLLVGGAFLAVAVPLALLVPSERTPSLVTVILLVAAYAFASRIEFEVGTGAAVPTQLVLVPMLFLLPAGSVPLIVAAGLVLGNVVNYLNGRIHLERVPLPLVSSWHAVGPALVLGIAGEPDAAWGDWPLYVAALGAQFAFDFGSAAAFEWLALGVSPRSRIRFTGWVNLVDVALSPIGLLIAFAAADVPYTFLLAVPLMGLLELFARERRVRIDHAVELSHAYRGTAFLLGDVVEADDAYTGSHSRDVVGLVLGVADELGLTGRDRRNAELAALLHDIGKIRIPGAIINKPGPLTPEERVLMETHTIEGERMLEGVGGLLGEVGRIVRSCHERWDGRGYPDGLAGEQTPLIARIVACCDAFSAMTTTRSYRAALPLTRAITEVEANSGSQFDPAVAEALLRVVAPSLDASVPPTRA